MTNSRSALRKNSRLLRLAARRLRPRSRRLFRPCPRPLDRPALGSGRSAWTTRRRHRRARGQADFRLPSPAPLRHCRPRKPARLLRRRRDRRAANRLRMASRCRPRRPFRAASTMTKRSPSTRETTTRILLLQCRTKTPSSMCASPAPRTRPRHNLRTWKRGLPCRRQFPPCREPPADSQPAASGQATIVRRASRGPSAAPTAKRDTQIRR